MFSQTDIITTQTNNNTAEKHVSGKNAFENAFDTPHALTFGGACRGFGLRYEADRSPLRGQSDSDWAVRHSTTGWQFTFSAATISWGSKKQTSVALSSCEAEIMAASEAAKEALFLSVLAPQLAVRLEHSYPADGKEVSK